MRILVSITCLLILTGCGHDAHPTTHSRPQASADHHETGLTLELDNGRKWQVDEHTRASAAQMLSLIGNAQPIDSVDGARQFAGDLDEELKNLIQGCTMTGPAHDQLHVVLAALFPKVGEMKTKTDLQELRAAQKEIVAVFDSYQRHFD